MAASSSGYPDNGGSSDTRGVPKGNARIIAAYVEFYATVAAAADLVDTPSDTKTVEKKLRNALWSVLDKDSEGMLANLFELYEAQGGRLSDLERLRPKRRPKN